MKIYFVTSVSVIKVSEEPLTLHIQAYGRVSSTGWTNVRLEPAAPVKGDRVLDYSFEADAPTGITGPVVLPVTAGLTIESKHAVDSIVVTSRTNSITVHASEFINHDPSAAPPQPAIQMQGIHPQGAGPQYGPGQHPHYPITSYIVGEEGPTWPFTEHHWPTYIGVEHSLPYIASENISLLNPAEGLLNPQWPGDPGPLQTQGGPLGSY